MDQIIVTLYDCLIIRTILERVMHAECLLIFPGDHLRGAYVVQS